MWVSVVGLEVLGSRGRWAEEAFGSMHGGGRVVGRGEKVVLIDLELAVLVGGGWFDVGMGEGRRLIVLASRLMLPLCNGLASCDLC